MIDVKKKNQLVFFNQKFSYRECLSILDDLDETKAGADCYVAFILNLCLYEMKTFEMVCPEGPGLIYNSDQGKCTPPEDVNDCKKKLIGRQNR